jgi:hypothetical protein
VQRMHGTAAVMDAESMQRTTDSVRATASTVCY